MAWNIITNPGILMGNNKLFESNDPYQWFSRVLCKVLDANKDVFSNMGVDINYIGCHSPRKGAATRAETGATVSPPMASICLRDGWSMGPVKERYIHYEKAVVILWICRF